MIEIKFSARFLKKLARRAEADAERNPDIEPHISVYILELAPGTSPKQYQFYVGETSRTVQERLAEHESGKGAAALRRGRHVIVGARDDLYAEFPKFRNVGAAKRAEGLVADELVRLGFRAESDQLKDKREKRKRKRAKRQA